MDKHELFLSAVHLKRKVHVVINSYEKGRIERICIPFDYGPSRKYADASYRYHFYDLNSPDGSHNLSVLPNQLIDITLLDETFEPKDYVTWSPVKWFIPRNWGLYS